MPIYSGECSEELAQHECNPCPTADAREFARARTSGFIFSDYLPAIMLDPTSLNAWITGVQLGKIIIVPETAGEYDPGTPKELKGYGDRPSTNGPRTMTLKFSDPNLAANYTHYNTLGNQTELVPFFRTSSQVRIFDKPASITAGDPVADDLEAEVTWNVSAAVISTNLPSFHSAANLVNTIFKCSYLNNVIAGTVNPVYDTTLEFDADSTDTAESVTGVIQDGNENTTQKFSFNKLTSPVGLPSDMSIMVGSNLGVIITFKSEYLNKPFKYVHNDGAVYTGLFTAGTVTFTASTTALHITTQPTNTTVADGAAATFTGAAAGGTGTKVYQWQKDISGTFTDVAGATAASYTIATAHSANNGSYRLKVVDGSGTVFSNAATLTVS